jgi:putative DNA primase/helicase
VRAIDVDITDETLSGHAYDALRAIAKATRVREDSPKFLVAFRLHGAYKKRIINAAHGRIEFLADGQQFLVAGSHPSGARYKWAAAGGLPAEIPTLSAAEFEEIWAALSTKFGVEPVAPGRPSTAETADHPGATVLTQIDEPAFQQLADAMRWPALLASAADNSAWSEIGYGLLSLAHTGRQLWLDFSAAAPNYEADAAETWWAAHVSQQPRTDYRHILNLARNLGWAAHVAAAEDFPEAPIDALDGLSVAETGTPELVREIPEAFGLCTDQRNAKRLEAAYKRRLIAVAGEFYAWVGTHWRRDEAIAARCAATLTRMVHDEARAAREKANSLTGGREKLDARTKEAKELAETPQGPEALDALAKAAALEKWAAACEMRSTQDNALALLRRMIQLDVDDLNQRPELLNCLNGTIDLRTGELREHRPADFITLCAPIHYRPDARCELFERFLHEILGPETARFMHTWLGYCITGETREQKFALHIGDGGNGKGVLFQTLENVLGRHEYLHTVAASLLVASGADNRHPTEIADLYGRRMVIASETEEGSNLRETFLKSATGEDTLSGRKMHKDLFTFRPTFKLQMSTNSKPTVKGADRGIWRRILLFWYGVKFGTAAEVARGVAVREQDVLLKEKLRAEREGIFAWLVRGARAWYAEGLKAPQSIVDATAEYQREQDRVADFTTAVCIIDSERWSPFSELYSAYTIWCRSNGYTTLGMVKFIRELERVVPKFRRSDDRRKVGDIWKTIKGCHGIIVNPDGDGGGVRFEKAEELA